MKSIAAAAPGQDKELQMQDLDSRPSFGSALQRLFVQNAAFGAHCTSMHNSFVKIGSGRAQVSALVPDDPSFKTAAALRSATFGS